MRLFKIMLIAGAIVLSGAVPAHAGPAALKPITVPELEALAQKLHTAGDGGAARMLSSVRLTERLSQGQIQALLAQMPGHHAIDQLIALADEAEFLPPPSSDLAARPPMSPDDQKALLARVLAYAKGPLAHWPRFTATRTALHFEGTDEPIAGGLQDELAAPLGRLWLRSPAARDWECPGRGKDSHARIAVIERTSSPVIYRQGGELHAMDVEGGEFACAENSVATSDEFAEVPGAIPLVLSKGSVTWARWEAGPAGPLAAFRFLALVDYKHGPHGVPMVIQLVGEIAVDPATGAIYRFTCLRRWYVDAFQKQYETMIEYAPISLGGTTVLLPQHRVSMYRTPYLRLPTMGKHVQRTYRHYGLTVSPLLEYLVDARFTAYTP